MKLKAITSILKANKQLYAYSTENTSDDESANAERWISNGAAVYKLDERIAFTTAEQWLVFLDVPDEKQKDWMFGDDILPKSPCFDGTDETEEELKILSFTVGHGDKVYRFLDYGGNIITVYEDYLKPFWGMDEEYVTFSARKDESGNVYVAVKAGFFLKAIIAPFLLEKPKEYDPHNSHEEFIESLNLAGQGLLKQMERWLLDHPQEGSKI